MYRSAKRLIRRRWRTWRVASAMLAVAGPYETTVIVTGTDLRSRPAGFSRALLDVFVKSSGDPALATDPRARTLAEHAESYVAAFSYVDPLAHQRPHDDQGTYDRSYDLTVTFDQARVDAALAQLGATPWRGRRPPIIPVLAVRGTERPWVLDLVLTADDPAAAPQRTALANAAARYGIELRLPTQAELHAWNVSTANPTASWQIPQDGAVLVVGRLEYRPERFGWVGAWHTTLHGVDTPSDHAGLNFDETIDHLVAGAVRQASANPAP